MTKSAKKRTGTKAQRLAEWRRKRRTAYEALDENAKQRMKDIRAQLASSWNYKVWK